METKMYHKTNSIGFSTYVALGSFAIGTLFLLLNLAFPRVAAIFIMGYLYALFAALCNSLVLLHLFYQLIIKPAEREEIVIRILILLANIPIAFLYYFIIITQY